MNEEQIRKIASETFTENIMNNLDSSIIFKYIQELEQENQDLKNQLSNGHQIKNQQKEIINIIENKFLESTLESYVCIKIEDYLKLKNILYR